MRRLSAIGFAVAIASATGCSFSIFKTEGPKAAAPANATLLRPEINFHKKLTASPVPEQDPVFLALEGEREQFKTATEGLVPDAQPKTVTAALTKYCQSLDQADVSQCPADFKNAHEKYRKACRQLVKVLGRLPDAYEGTEFYDTLYAMFRGTPDKGKPLGGDVVKAVKEMTTSFQQLYSAAESFGIGTER